MFEKNYSFLVPKAYRDKQSMIKLKGTVYFNISICQSELYVDNIDLHVISMDKFSVLLFAKNTREAEKKLRERKLISKEAKEKMIKDLFE